MVAALSVTRAYSNIRVLPVEMSMRVIVAVLAFTTFALGGCAVAGAVGSVASAAGSVVVTTADVAGDVVGSAAGAVTGGGGHDHDMK
jgi:hypothetical protein